MEKLDDFVLKLKSRIGWDKRTTKDCEISQAIYTRLEQDIKEIMEEIDGNSDSKEC